MAKGKFEYWLTEDGLLRIQGWARDGLTDAQIAHNIGVSYSTFKEWLVRFPDMSASLKKGKAPVDIEVENALLKRALGYETEEVFEEIFEMPDGSQRKHIRRVKKQIPPEPVAIFFWLKNRRPLKWRDKQEISTSSDGKLSELIEGLKEKDDLHTEAIGSDAPVAKE